jgi:hypothetical protein
LLARPFHFEHEFERGLMLDGPLVIGITEAHPDEAHVEAGAFGDLCSSEGPGHAGRPEKVPTENMSFRLAEREGFEPSKGF